MKQSMKQFNHHQRGAVLAVSLIILLVMTVLAASTMGVSKMEEKMAANTQNTTVAFQVSESVIREIINDRDVLSAAIVDANNQVSQLSGKTFSGVDNAFYQVEFTGDGVQANTASSIVSGEGSFTAYRFDVKGIATIGEHIQTSTSQGIYTLGPTNE